MRVIFGDKVSPVGIDLDRRDGVEGGSSEGLRGDDGGEPSGECGENITLGE